MNLIDTLRIIIISLTCTVVIHIVICHLTSVEKFMLKGLLLGLFATVALIGYFIIIERFDIVGIYLFFTAWLSYLMAFINLLNSVTLKMLERLYYAPNGFLGSEDFKFVFNTEDGLKTRLDSMILNSFIIQKDESIELTPKALFLVRIVRLLRSILSIDQVG